LLAEFAYNNTKYSVIGISLFYACYRFYLYLEYKVKADDSSSVLAALERIKRISLKREALAKRWEYAAEA
jgi:hypothetical protein